MLRPAVLLSTCLLPVVLGAQTRPSADALATSLQQRYQGIRDFSADFVHTYRGGVLRTQTTERGRVLIKKPGLMRWTYTVSRKEGVRVGRSQGVFAYSSRQTGHRDVAATRRSGDDAGALPGR